MENSISERNQRQLAQINKVLDVQSIKASTLGKIVPSLEFLLSNLEAVDETWKRKFQKELNVLEEGYALALDEKRELSASEVSIVEAAINKLKKLLTEIV